MVTQLVYSGNLSRFWISFIAFWFSYSQIYLIIWFSNRSTLSVRDEGYSRIIMSCRAYYIISLHSLRLAIVLF
jgi:hypothetical protein